MKLLSNLKNNKVDLIIVLLIEGTILLSSFIAVNRLSS